MAGLIDKLPSNVQKESRLPISKVNLPPLPLTGGCQCAKVRYSITKVPVVFYLCHCRECQRHTSSAFGESLRVRKEDLVVEGSMKTFERISEAGNRRQGHFCPDCGVRVVHGTAGSPVVNIKAGTLDDATWLMPAGHIWTRSKQAFVAIGEDELAYREGPDDDLCALTARWQEMIARS
jgi:hypothetical protein